jgi:hypothetical protein
MRILTANIKWIMLVSGLLTCTMFYAAIAPQASLRSTFGEGVEGAVAEIVVRNWGALIGIVGVLLIYGAFNPPLRPVALSVAGVSKIVFIGLVLTLGRQYLGKAGVAIVVDAIMVAIFAVYLLSPGSSKPDRYS